MARQPDGPPPPPTVQRLRIRYAKRGRLRFASRRDLARALERALRRARVPMAFSAGFSAHPKISYLGAASTGAARAAPQDWQNAWVSDWRGAPHAPQNLLIDGLSCAPRAAVP